MPTQDTSQLKERIISIIRNKGPSLPIHISQGIGMSMLFASAFLSELLSEKKLKISNMKVGNSPIYFISGQEVNLEKYSNHLKSKEKDAFHLLKEKSFLKDIVQEPAIRVALRSIRDFAIPFKKGEDVFWRYVSVPEDDLQEDEKIVEKENLPHTVTLPKEVIRDKVEEPKENEGAKDLEIFDKTEVVKPKKKIIKKAVRKKTASKVNEKFFEKVKKYLSSKQIEILDIVGFSKNDLFLKIKDKDGEKFLVAYNKKTIKEEDILKAYKKSQDLNLKYFVLSLGEPLKKLTNFIDAINNLEEIEKIEE